MSTEQNLQTVQNFTDNGWRETSHARRIEEIISTHNETHRLPDNWAYFTDEDGLYVTSKDEKEKNQKIYVTDVIQKTGYPESIEAEVLNKLDDWSKNSESGTAVWISPPYPGKYPCSKVLFHQIAYEYGTLKKSVLNSAILFDAGDVKTLEILHRFFPETSEVNNLESFRNVFIIPENNFDLQNFLSTIKGLDKNTSLEKPKLSREELTTRAAYISTLIEAGTNSRYVSYEMQRLGLLGEFSISCPGKSVSFSDSIDLTPTSLLSQVDGWHSGTCRVCGNPTWVGPCSICKPCESKF